MGEGARWGRGDCAPVGRMALARARRGAGGRGSEVKEGRLRTGGADGVDEGEAARVRVVGAVEHGDGVGRCAQESRHVSHRGGIAASALVHGGGVGRVEPLGVWAVHRRNDRGRIGYVGGADDGGGSGGGCDDGGVSI